MINHLKVERAKKNITQAELANIVGVSRQTINAIEQGKFNPSTLIALRLSEYFNVTVNDLFKLQQEERIER